MKPLVYCFVHQNGPFYSCHKLISGLLARQTFCGLCLWYNRERPWHKRTYGPCSGSAQ